MDVNSEPKEPKGLGGVMAWLIAVQVFGLTVWLVAAILFLLGINDSEYGSSPLLIFSCLVFVMRAYVLFACLTKRHYFPKAYMYSVGLFAVMTFILSAAEKDYEYIGDLGGYLASEVWVFIYLIISERVANTFVREDEITQSTTEAA